VEHLNPVAMANAVLFLACDEARFRHGRFAAVDLGASIK
jgi:hypothetical protein